jgi:GNAT superfamily N-acetyltransferase
MARGEAGDLCTLDVALLDRDDVSRSVTELAARAAADLLVCKPDLEDIYTPGLYCTQPGYAPELVPPLAEIIGGARLGLSPLRRALTSVACRDDAFVVVARDERDRASGLLVGFVETLRWNNARLGQIDLTYVDPRFRRSGVGGRLVERALCEFRARSCTSVWGILLLGKEEHLSFWRRAKGREWGLMIRHPTCE